MRDAHLTSFPRRPLPVLSSRSRSLQSAGRRTSPFPGELHHKTSAPQATQSLPTAFCSLSCPRRITPQENSMLGDAHLPFLKAFQPLEDYSISLQRHASGFPTTFRAALSPLSCPQHELPPLVEDCLNCVLRDADDALFGVNCIACVTTPQKRCKFIPFRARSFFRSPSQALGGCPSMRPPPHPLIFSSFAHRQLQLSLSAGFRDISIYSFVMFCSACSGRTANEFRTCFNASYGVVTSCTQGS